MARQPILRKPDYVTVAFWNADGINNKKHELVDFICRLKVDIMLLGETHMNPGDKLRVPNFVTYRHDRVGPKGGTAILIKNTLKHTAINVPRLETLEATAIRLETLHSGCINIVSVYKSPSKALEESDLDSLLNLGQSTIIAGDLNCKSPDWNSLITNTNGRRLKAFAENRYLAVVGPLQPTRYGYGRPDVLDIAIMHNVAMTYSISTVTELSSDHNPVLLELGTPTTCNDQFRTKKVSWHKFKSNLENAQDTINLYTSKRIVDEATSSLQTTIQTALVHATRYENSVSQPNSRLPDSVQELIRNRRRAKRLYQNTLNPAHKTELNRLTNQVRLALSELENDRWGRKLESLQTTDNSLWRMSKALRGAKHNLPPIHGSRGVTYDDEDKAEAFAESLELQCTPNYDENTDLDHLEDVERNVAHTINTPNDDRLSPTNVEEVKQIIKDLAQRKAPGPDGITNTALKLLPDNIVEQLVCTFNCALQTQYFPTNWKIANVVFLPKGQPTQFPQDYRPISLLNTLGKVYEAVILKRLKREVEDNNIIQLEQFGFRTAHSTTEQALRLAEHITKSYSHGKATGAVFLDVAKAFDKVWHQGLLYKMTRAGCSTAMVKIIASYLHRRKFKAKIGSSTSTEKQYTAGVPQGSLLAPTLFNIYVSDMPKSPRTDLALYADDTAVYTSSRSPTLVCKYLQQALDDLTEWFDKWRIKINASKTQAVFFTRRRLAPDAELDLDDQPIPWKDEATYLGLILDKRLKWIRQTDAAISKGNAALGALYPLLNRRSRLSLRNKRTLYVSILRPILLYATPVWCYTSKTQLQKLERFQSKVLRIAANAPWFVRNEQLRSDFALDSIAKIVHDTARKTYEKAATHENSLIRKATDYDFDSIRKHKRPKLALLQ